MIELYMYALQKPLIYCKICKCNISVMNHFFKYHMFCIFFYITLIYCSINQHIVKVDFVTIILNEDFSHLVIIVWHIHIHKYITFPYRLSEQSQRGWDSWALYW
jgi:hypothetical protein